jgi:glycine cleavage system H protein
MSWKVAEDCRFTQSHEWIRLENGICVTGITDYAQDQLSDIVYVELPETGDQIEQGQTYGVVESVKAASDVYMGMGGEITDLNGELEESPQLVNEDPYGAGWFLRFIPSEPSEFEALMTPDAYEAFCEEESKEGSD